MIPAFQHKPEKKLTYAERCKAGLVKPKARTRVKAVSAKLKPWLDAYYAQIEKDLERQECFSCHAQGTKHSLQRHHTHGRSKDNILVYQYCCEKCHTWIHANPKLARANKLLFF
jgi:hypothetical protein